MGNGHEKKESFFKFDITAERIGLEETLGMFVDALPINSDLSDFFLLNFLGMFVVCVFDCEETLVNGRGALAITDSLTRGDRSL